MLKILTIHIGKKKKGIQIGNEEVKLSLFVTDMILYVQNSKDFAKKLLEKKIRNNKLTEKSLGYKINIKNVTSLYTQNELVERQV